MFFLKEDDALVPTSLMAGDRIRVRPGIGKFCVWRPIVRSWFAVRRATRLWMPDCDGNYRRWLDLPNGDSGASDDLLRRIVSQYGVEHFDPPGLSWIEEYPAFPVDGRFDYVAVARSSR